MNQFILKHMYQAWQQDNTEYLNDYLAFVELVKNQYPELSSEQILLELKTYRWFNYTIE